MQLLEDLHWRYAAKKLNGEKVPGEKLQNILEAIRLAATSYGLQPFKVIVVSDDATKSDLMNAAYGQQQIGTASEVLVFAVPDTITEADVDAYIELIAEVRSMQVEQLQDLKQMIVGTTLQLSEEQKRNWSAKQAYIALGTALIAAAEQKIDACPMEGFDNAKFDEILGLREHGLNSVVIMPVGFRSPDDKYATAPKVRKSQEQLFIKK